MILKNMLPQDIIWDFKVEAPQAYPLDFRETPEFSFAPKKQDMHPVP